MTEALRPMLELAIVFPAALLCFLPMKGRLRLHSGRLALLTVPALLVWCVLGGWLCAGFGWKSDFWLLPSLVLFALLYRKAVDLPGWKSMSVFLGVCGVFSCTTGLAVVADALLYPESAAIWFYPEAGVFHNLLCWLLVGALWYPATHAARKLLGELELPGTWYVFWLLPVIFIALNVYLKPVDYHTLYAGRMMYIYTVMCLLLLGLMLFCYLLFYLMARSLGENLRLQQANQFLQMQTAQYANLRQTIAETRQARHDLRHHFTTLSALAEKGAWEELRTYLREAGGSVPATELELCANPAADGVAGYYAARFQREGIPFSCRLNLPEVLPVPEMDLCVVLSNLLENALEAGLRLPPMRRRVSLQGEIHGERLVLLTTENACGAGIVEREGIFQSSKRSGPGVGLQSVRRIAEKNGGYCKFAHENGVFQANVMLRGAGETEG